MNKNEINNSGETTPTCEETPEFCKRKNLDTVDIDAKLITHNELIKIGSLINEKNIRNNTYDENKNVSSDINTIKTMTLEELYEYVENKLSKTHYSPEVIYLLFKMQCLLLEKINYTKELNNNKNIINELKKELLDDKNYIQDLKDVNNDTTNELETLENEMNIKIINYEKDYNDVKEKYNYIYNKKKNYEKIIKYCIPISIVFITIYLNNIINYITKNIYNLF